MNPTIAQIMRCGEIDENVKQFVATLFGIDVDEIDENWSEPDEQVANKEDDEEIMIPLVMEGLSDEEADILRGFSHFRVSPTDENIAALKAIFDKGFGKYAQNYKQEYKIKSLGKPAFSRELISKNGTVLIFAYTPYQAHLLRKVSSVSTLGMYIYRFMEVMNRAVTKASILGTKRSQRLVESVYAAYWELSILRSQIDHILDCNYPLQSEFNKYLDASKFNYDKFISENYEDYNLWGDVELVAGMFADTSVWNDAFGK